MYEHQALFIGVGFNLHNILVYRHSYALINLLISLLIGNYL